MFGRAGVFLPNVAIELTLKKMRNDRLWFRSGNKKSGADIGPACKKRIE